MGGLLHNNKERSRHSLHVRSVHEKDHHDNSFYMHTSSRNTGPFGYTTTDVGVHTGVTGIRRTRFTSVPGCCIIMA